MTLSPAGQKRNEQITTDDISIIKRCNHGLCLINYAYYFGDKRPENRSVDVHYNKALCGEGKSAYRGNSEKYGRLITGQSL